VLLRFHKQNGSYVLRFSDNGVGMPAGVDFRRTESLGLQLVTTLTTRIGGVIQHFASPGTVFCIEFAPLPQLAAKAS
jgi:two-component sensor histidine kinase